MGITRTTFARQEAEITSAFSLTRMLLLLLCLHFANSGERQQQSNGERFALNYSDGGPSFPLRVKHASLRRRFLLR